MQKLEDHIGKLLQGKVETISTMDLRKRPGECLTQVSLGKTFCITRRGKIVAYLTPHARITHVIKSDGTCETLDMDFRRDET